MRQHRTSQSASLPALLKRRAKEEQSPEVKAVNGALEQLVKLWDAGAVATAENVGNKKSPGKGEGVNNTDVKLSDRVSEVVDKAISEKGSLGLPYNQAQIAPVPKDTADMVFKASEGMIDVSAKNIALNGDDIWHEFIRHSDVQKETSRDQIPMTKRKMVNAIKRIYSPMMVEALIYKSTSGTVRQSFAYTRKTSRGHYVVVEAVGGKKNPNIVPVMIIEVSNSKWNKWIKQGKSLGEMLYANDQEKLKALDPERSKKIELLRRNLL